MTVIYQMNEISSPSLIVVEEEALHSLLQVERVEIIECHQMPISTKDKHFIFENIDRLSISSAGLLPDDETVGLVINDFLMHFVFVLLLDACINWEIPIVSRVFSMD